MPCLVRSRSRRPFPGVLCALLGPILAVCGGGSPSTPTPSAAPTPTATGVRPNIVLILTDDLDTPTTERMPRLGEFARQGLSFNHFYAAEPLCAPSRASILTGQYAHNHGVLYNEPPNGGFPAFRGSEASTIATWLHGAGYRTSLVGKYLNGYALGAGEGYVPPGWDDWHGHLTALEDGRYFNYWVNDNGEVIRHGSEQKDYSTDVASRQAVEFIRAEAGKLNPIFLYVGVEAPHVPANYAQRYGDEFRYELAPRGPSFDVSDTVAPMTGAEIDKLDELQRWRMRSLGSVEDLLDAVTQALAETGRLEHTYVLFTSDNGLLMGQHRGQAAKSNFYEETIGVPLYVRGPGVSVGRVEQLALNIDLAPTLAELAGLPFPDGVDGRSLAPFLRGSPPSSWRSDVYVENYAGPDQTYALRSPDQLYANSDEIRLFDMRADPYQIKNLRRLTSPSVLEALERRAAGLARCRGATCRE
jgi:N-acetylglucosamine-6-sulfatase